MKKNMYHTVSNPSARRIENTHKYRKKGRGESGEMRDVHVVGDKWNGFGQQGVYRFAKFGKFGKS